MVINYMSLKYEKLGIRISVKMKIILFRITRKKKDIMVNGYTLKISLHVSKGDCLLVVCLP